MALLKSQLLGVYFQPRHSPAVACETNYLTFITLSACATHIAAWRAMGFSSSSGIYCFPMANSHVIFMISWFMFYFNKDSDYKV